MSEKISLDSSDYSFQISIFLLKFAAPEPLAQLV